MPRGQLTIEIRLRQQVTRLKNNYTRYREEIATLKSQLASLVERLRTYRHALFVCATNPAIPADNNQAERKLRHIVLKRKNSFGTRSSKGSQIFSINASVLLSQWWQDRDNFFPRIHQLLNVL